MLLLCVYNIRLRFIAVRETVQMPVYEYLFSSMYVSAHIQFACSLVSKSPKTEVSPQASPSHPFLPSDDARTLILDH